MKTMIFFFALLAVSVFSQPVTITTNSIEKMGWASPTGSSLVTNKAYNFKSSVYFSNWGVWHSGDDFLANLGSDVYSICDGVVEVVRSAGNESYLVVKATSQIGTVYFIYGHVKASVAQGSTVSRGQRLGSILRYGSPDHLHFGVQKGKLDLRYGWGRTPANIDPLSLGFVSPSEFLTTVATSRLRLASSVVVSPVLLEQGGNNKVSVSLKNFSTSTFTGSVSAALHRPDGSFVTDIQVLNISLSADQTKGYTFTNGLNNLMPGKYKVVLKEKASSGAWVPIAPNGYSVPASIDLAFKLSSAIKIVGTVYTNGTIQATYAVKNFASTTFRGDFALALHSSSGAFLEDILVMTNQTVSSNQTKAFAFSKKLNRPKGAYKLVAKVKTGSSWIQIGSGSYSNPISFNILQRSIENEAGPVDFTLDQNYPNPFNPTTMIRFAVPADMNVKLDVYNTLGEKVAELINGPMTAGTYEVPFNAASLPSGIYFYRIEAGSNVAIKKMILAK
ncbi:MAG: hypothetical protein HBSAPP04_20640 [Ignavibacteriaceae bacterium]|nr:MAG: T9SS C-terminal target domain-containing protein [Chlorobiota bacterium]GJQ33225.1 MAG: hypothetical protein HBSAPP04_20640 [Ignavibacteriaceae bacterium]